MAVYKKAHFTKAYKTSVQNSCGRHKCRNNVGTSWNIMARRRWGISTSHNWGIIIIILINWKKVNSNKTNEWILNQNLAVTNKNTTKNNSSTQRTIRHRHSTKISSSLSIMVTVANRVIIIDDIITITIPITITIATVTMSSICKRVQREASLNNCRIK